nr:hypothetical protein [Plantactinospora sp. KBS50]
MTTFTRILTHTTSPLLRKAALTTAGLAFTTGAIAGPLTLTTEAHATPPTPPHKPTETTTTAATPTRN